MNDNDTLDLAAIRARLKSVKGKAYWRSLEELAETAEFKALLAREFPRQALAAGVLNRRDFLKLMAAQGAGLRILTGAMTSPTLIDQLQGLLKQYPAAKWIRYEPINRDNVYAGTQLAFGQALEPVYHLDKADVILSLNADFLRSVA